jgi:hypothetical protein
MKLHFALCIAFTGAASLGIPEDGGSLHDKSPIGADAIANPRAPAELDSVKPFAFNRRSLPTIIGDTAVIGDPQIGSPATTETVVTFDPPSLPTISGDHTNIIGPPPDTDTVVAPPEPTETENPTIVDPPAPTETEDTTSFAPPSLPTISGDETNIIGPPPDTSDITTEASSATGDSTVIIPPPTDTESTKPEPTDPETTGPETTKPEPTVPPVPTETDGPDATETDGPDPTETDGPDPTKPDGPDPTNPDGPDPTKPDGPDPTNPDGPDPTKPDGPDPTKPDGSDPTIPPVTKPDDPDPTETDGPDPTETDGPDPTETDGPDPTESEGPDECTTTTATGTKVVCNTWSTSTSCTTSTWDVSGCEVTAPVTTITTCTRDDCDPTPLTAVDEFATQYPVGETVTLDLDELSSYWTSLHPESTTTSAAPEPSTIEKTIKDIGSDRSECDEHGRFYYILGGGGSSWFTIPQPDMDTLKLTVPKVDEGGDWKLELPTPSQKEMSEEIASWSVTRLDTSEEINSGKEGPIEWTAPDSYEDGVVIEMTFKTSKSFTINPKALSGEFECEKAPPPLPDLEWPDPSKNVVCCYDGGQKSDYGRIRLAAESFCKNLVDDPLGPIFKEGFYKPSKKQPGGVGYHIQFEVEVLEGCMWEPTFNSCMRYMKGPIDSCDCSKRGDKQGGTISNNCLRLRVDPNNGI